MSGGILPDYVAGCPLDLLLAPNPAKQHNLLPAPLPDPVTAPGLASNATLYDTPRVFL